MTRCRELAHGEGAEVRWRVAREVRPPEVGGSRAVPRAIVPVPEPVCWRRGAEGLAGKRGAAAMMFVPLIIRCITARKDACGSQQCGCKLGKIATDKAKPASGRQTI